MGSCLGKTKVPAYSGPPIHSAAPARGGKRTFQDSVFYKPMPKRNPPGKGPDGDGPPGHAAGHGHGHGN